MAAADYIADCARTDDEFVLAAAFASGARLDAWQCDSLLRAVQASTPLPGREPAKAAALDALADLDADAVIDARTGTVVCEGGPVSLLAYA